MQNKTLKTVLGGLLSAAMVAAAALPVSAAGLAGSLSLSVSASSSGLKAGVQANLLVRGKTRADQEIDRRKTSLNALDVRVKAMVKLSDSEKTSLDSAIQAQLSQLASLKAKIDGDTDLVTLRTDVQSITKSYRIFVLIIPQGAIMAAADRVETIAGSSENLSGKLQARITQEQSMGNNMSSSVSAFADFNAKIADANVQAQAAVTELASLAPDNGDQAKLRANQAALKDARSKIHAAQQDFVAARKDAGIIVKQLIALDKGLSASANASATTTVNR